MNNSKFDEEEDIYTVSKQPPTKQSSTIKGNRELAQFQRLADTTLFNKSK